MMRDFFQGMAETPVPTWAVCSAFVGRPCHLVKCTLGQGSPCRAQHRSSLLLTKASMRWSDCPIPIPILKVLSRQDAKPAIGEIHQWRHIDARLNDTANPRCISRRQKMRSVMQTNTQILQRQGLRRRSKSHCARIGAKNSETHPFLQMPWPGRFAWGQSAWLPPATGMSVPCRHFRVLG